jgi:hypothetical protein
MHSRTLSFTSAAMAVSLLAAGCGGGSRTTAAVTQPGLVAYSHCMRSHGVPNFPDPTAGEGIPKDKIPVGSPQFGAASNDCEHSMPVSGLGPQTTPEQARARVADEISFARCLRTHGFQNFPDPTITGQLTRAMLANAGIDVHQPAVLQAADACVAVTDGLMTRATVVSFIAGH